MWPRRPQKDWKRSAGSGTPAVVIAVYGNRAFEKAAAGAGRARRPAGIRPRSRSGIRRRALVQHPRNPRRRRTPRRAGPCPGRGVRRRGAQKTRGGNACPGRRRKLKDAHTPLVPMLRFIRFVVGYRHRQKKNPVVYLPACDADRCTHCGRCAAICPTQAIARGDEAHTDPARCIRCCACVKGCPVGARSFHTPFAAALARSFTRRKQPVTIL